MACVAILYMQYNGRVSRIKLPKRVISLITIGYRFGAPVCHHHPAPPLNSLFQIILLTASDQQVRVIDMRNSSLLARLVYREYPATFYATQHPFLDLYSALILVFREHNRRPKREYFDLSMADNFEKNGNNDHPDQTLANTGTSVIRDQLFDHVYRSMSPSAYKVYDLYTNLHVHHICIPYLVPNRVGLVETVRIFAFG